VDHRRRGYYPHSDFRDALILVFLFISDSVSETQANLPSAQSERLVTRLVVVVVVCRPPSVVDCSENVVSRLVTRLVVVVVVCRPPSDFDCVENVISGQCGEEIAGQLRQLGNKLMSELGCQTRKRSSISFLLPRMHSVK